MLEQIIDIIGLAFIALGVFFLGTSALGMLRMPDFYTRLHPAGLADSLGAPCVLLGIAIQHGFSFFSAKIILLILFLLITNSTATHALAKAAAISGLKPWGREKK